MNEKVTQRVTNSLVSHKTLKLEEANRCIEALKNIGCNVTLPAMALRLFTEFVDKIVDKCELISC